jgi:sarcosine oxidase, subunit beta
MTVGDTQGVVVIGAGVIGLSCAMHALESGCTVTVLEQSHPAAGSSGWAVGIINRQYVTPLEVQIRVRSFDRFAEFEMQDGLRITRNGFMRIGRDDASLRQFADGVAIQRENGVTDARVLEPSAVAEIVPDLNPDGILGALYSPTDGYVDSHELCQVYLQRIKALGGEVRAGARFIAREPGSRRRHRVITSGEPLETDVIVNAGGAWAQRVGEKLGTPLPIINERHQVCIGRFNRPLGYVMPSVMDYVVGSGAEGTYFRHEGADQLIGGLHTNELIGAGSEDPDSYRAQVDQTYVDTVAANWLQRLPSLGDMTLVRGWAGLYPMTPDAQPLLGPHREDPTVLAACGFGGVGVMLSPVAGRLIADWIVHGEPRTVPAAVAFLPDRWVAA